MIIETIVIANAVFIATKTVHTSVLENEEIKNKILEEGLYHVTYDQNVYDIIKSGELRPGEDGPLLRRNKVYFFAGIPSWNDLCINVDMFNLEMKAIKINLNSKQIADLTHRQFSDQAIAYDGVFKLPKSQVDVVDLVVDLDEKNEIIVRERSKDDYYYPLDNEELVYKMNASGALRNAYNAMKKDARYSLNGIKNLAIYCKKKTSDVLTKTAHELSNQKKR